MRIPAARRGGGLRAFRACWRRCELRCAARPRGVDRRGPVNEPQGKPQGRGGGWPAGAQLRWRCAWCHRARPPFRWQGEAGGERGLDEQQQVDETPPDWPDQAAGKCPFMAEWLAEAPVIKLFDIALKTN